jgi:hypothetical protein
LLTPAIEGREIVDADTRGACMEGKHQWMMKMIFLVS